MSADLEQLTREADTADKKALDECTRAELHKLAYVADHLTSAETAYVALVGEDDDVYFAIVAARAAVAERETEIREDA